MTSFCFAAPVEETDAAAARQWLEALKRPDPRRDLVLSTAGIQIDLRDLQRTRSGRLLVIGFESDDPARAFPVLEGSGEPWTQRFWDFLQHAAPFHPEPPSPLDLLMEEVRPVWDTLRSDMDR